MLGPGPQHCSQGWFCSVWSRHWVSSALQYFSHFLYGFFPWLAFSDVQNRVGACRLCSVGLCRIPVLALHVCVAGEPSRSSVPRRGARLAAQPWQPRCPAGQGTVLTELPEPPFLLHCCLSTAPCRSSLLLTLTTNTVLEPVSYSDHWLYHYSSIKTGAKQLTGMRRCMKMYRQVFSLVEWGSTSMVNIDTMPLGQLLLPNRLTSSLSWEGV